MKKVKVEERQDLEKRRHYWIYGDPNSGKTTWKNTFLKDDFEIPKNNDWTGYKGETELWIDEFKG